MRLRRLALGLVLLFGHIGISVAADHQPSSPNYNLSASLEDNLKAFKGKKIDLTLSGSSEKISGKLVAVKNGLVHLEAIAHRNFFDALIRIDAIIAVEVQFRGLN